MMHYPLFPHSYGCGHVFYPSKNEDSGMGYETVRNQLADAGIKVIFTGHHHFNDIAKDWNADFSRIIYDVITGSTSQYPFYYRIVTFSEDLRKMEINSHRVLSDNLFNIEDAKARYTSDRILKSMISKLIAHGISEDTASIAAPYMNMASLFHAEGDESKSIFAQELLMDMKSLQITSSYFMDYATSTLLDISNYGDAEREDQTDDNNLVINLDDNYSSINGVGSESFVGHECWYSVRGCVLKNKPTRKGVYLQDGRKVIIR